MSYDMMTDEEYKAMDEAEVKPCPFCGKEMIFTDDHHGAYYEHPDGKCYESHAQLLEIEEVRRWNQRAATQNRGAKCDS